MSLIIWYLYLFFYLFTERGQERGRWWCLLSLKSWAETGKGVQVVARRGPQGRRAGTGKVDLTGLPLWTRRFHFTGCRLRQHVEVILELFLCRSFGWRLYPSTPFPPWLKIPSWHVNRHPPLVCTAGDQKELTQLQKKQMLKGCSELRTQHAQKPKTTLALSRTKEKTTMYRRWEAGNVDDSFRKARPVRPAFAFWATVSLGAQTQWVAQLYSSGSLNCCLSFLLCPVSGPLLQDHRHHT